MSDEIGFREAVRLGFINYFKFSGRARRSEYWWFYLFTVLAIILLSVVDVIIFGIDVRDDISPLSDLFWLAIIIPSLSLGWRRMHDIGKSGWWCLLWLAPVIWTVVAAVTLFSSSDSYGAVGVIAMIIGGLATIASIIYIIVLLATDSDPETNRFGPSPKYRDMDPVF